MYQNKLKIYNNLDEYRFKLYVFKMITDLNCIFLSYGQKFRILPLLFIHKQC